MGWLATFSVAVLTAASCALASGFVANLAVRWYHVSTREGGAGYFVMAMALLGLIGGFVVGIVGSRVAAAREGGEFFGALGLSLGVGLTVVGAVGGISRLLADVPPEVDGEELWLMLDVRLPEGAGSPSNAGDAKLNLGSLSGHTMRVSREGALFAEDAHLVDGRWVVPGAAEIFTTRGKLSFDVALGSVHEGFLLPFSGRPGKSDFAWSPWLPKVAARGFTLTYRYRVQKRDEPFRTQAVGPFEVDTTAGGLYQAVGYGGRGVLSASALFKLRHRGAPVKLGNAEGDGERRFDSADAVMVLPGPVPALLVHVWDDARTSSCYLLENENGALRQTFVAKTANGIGFDELTDDPRRFHALKTKETVRGWLDFKTLASPAILRVGLHGILDTGRRSVRRFDAKVPDGVAPVGMPPIGVSPGGKSFVQLAYAGGSAENPVLLVTDTVNGRVDVLPIDRARMRYLSLEWLDPAWVDHHFAWHTEADGGERLDPRETFTPLPYRGTLSPPSDGYREYRIEAGEALRAALLDFLVKEMHGERLPAEPDAYKQPVRIGGKTVDVTKGDGSTYFAVSVDKGKEEGEVIAAIAKRFDAELATGKYDALFAR